MALAVVRDLREWREPATAEELADLETDVFAGFVLARASASHPQPAPEPSPHASGPFERR